MVKLFYNEKKKKKLGQKKNKRFWDESYKSWGFKIVKQILKRIGTYTYVVYYVDFSEVSFLALFFKSSKLFLSEN